LDSLATELTGSGALDEPAVAWAVAHQHENHVSFDTALLELELVDEETLLNGLASSFGMKAARRGDLPTPDPEISRRLPSGFSRSFGFCPVRLTGAELVAMVRNPLPRESVQELSELFGLTPRQLVAPDHYIALALSTVYGTALSERSVNLEARLALRTNADVRRPLAAIDGAPSFSAAAREVLGYAATLLEHASFVVCGADALRVVASTSPHDPKRGLPLPGATCTVGPALRHGGFFLGAVAGTPADRALFDALDRPLPRSAVVAPVAASPHSSVVLLADNGARGIARRWAAELTLLAARLGQRRNREVQPPRPAVPESPPAPVVDATPEPSPRDTMIERVVARLGAAAEKEGLSLEAFVEQLLEERAARAHPDVGAAVAGEVKGLFERLATDIPAHLAKGMEAAFRDLVPRLVSGPAAAPAPAPAHSPTPAAAVDLQIVSGERTPKEVPSYQSQRRKTSRVKL
jgi:hypothetical protein